MYFYLFSLLTLNIHNLKNKHLLKKAIFTMRMESNYSVNLSIAQQVTWDCNLSHFWISALFDKTEKKFSFILLSLWQWIFLLFFNGSNKIQKRNLLRNLDNSQASSIQQVWEVMYSFPPELSMNSNHINFTVRQYHWLCIYPTVQGNIINVNISHSINDTPQLASWRGPRRFSQ